MVPTADMTEASQLTTSALSTKQGCLNIGTRKSKLALIQAELAVDALKRAWPGHPLRVYSRDTAAGDVDKVTPFKDMPVKNLWTHELEQLMIEGKLDLLVHSLKGILHTPPYHPAQVTISD
jgi:hydroxymethylbilane synthase